MRVRLVVSGGIPLYPARFGLVEAPKAVPWLRAMGSTFFSQRLRFPTRVSMILFLPPPPPNPLPNHCFTACPRQDRGGDGTPAHERNRHVEDEGECDQHRTEGPDGVLF